LKNNDKLCPFKKLSVFYNSCLKTFGSHLVYSTLKENHLQSTNILFTRSFVSVKFPTLLSNMNTNRFFLFLSVKEEVMISPQAPVSLTLDRVKCYTLKHLKLCSYVCTPHLEDGRNGNKVTCILYLRTWIRAFSFSHRPLYPGGNGNLCPLLEGGLDCGVSMETVG
jgi:hypothetical protein